MYVAHLPLGNTIGLTNAGCALGGVPPEVPDGIVKLGGVVAIDALNLGIRSGTVVK